MKTPGIYEDGGGLRLMVGDSLTKRWVLRVTINGKRRERGLGSFRTVSLEEARDRAAALRKRHGRAVILRPKSGVCAPAQASHSPPPSKHTSSTSSTHSRTASMSRNGAAPCSAT
ncbi:MAG: DUF4102 domain-containing protein [Rhodospirillales bacterium]|nr:DUF4102 domain-containing protein [Rhodospirillales bacterium]